MKASEYCKKIGLPNLKYLSDHTGVSQSTLRGWYKNKNKLFTVVSNDARNKLSLDAMVDTFEKMFPLHAERVRMKRKGKEPIKLTPNR